MLYIHRVLQTHQQQQPTKKPKLLTHKLLSHLVEECHEYEHITDTEFLVHL